MTKRDHYICAALAGVVARMHYRADDPQEHVKAAKLAIAYAEVAMREADRTTNEEGDVHSAAEPR